MKDHGVRRGLPWSTFVFPPEFRGFAGHFPGRPILPGVCMLKAAAVTLERWHGRSLRVQGARRARFLSLVMPGQEFHVECTRSEQKADGFTAMMSFRVRSDPKPSECTLHYSFAGG